MGLNPVRTAVLIATVLALQLTGCTAEPGRPQGRPVATIAPPVPPPTPQPHEVAPPPRATPPAPDSAQTAVAGDRPKIALLVPLTGPNRLVGQAMLDAANMALFDVAAEIVLFPRDTGNTPDGARAAAQKALSDGAGLILGPVFSNSVEPVRSATSAADIAALSFSTDAAVAGGNVFVMGFLPAQQVDRVVGFARSRGLAKIAALVPDSPYGTAVAAELGALRERLALPPPRIVKLEADPKPALDGLAQDPPDALLIAVGGDQLRTLAPALADFKAAHPVQLLGTGLWDDPAISQNAALIGGWYAAPLPEGFTNFESRFQGTYNYRPPRIASLAYDAIALAAAIAKGAPGDPRPFGRDVLTQSNGFLGIDGAFRFLPSGLSERNLAVLAVSANGPQILDPPPPGFEKLGE